MDPRDRGQKMKTHTSSHTHSPGLRFPLEQALSPPLRVWTEMVGQLTTNLLHRPERIALLSDKRREESFQLLRGDEKSQQGKIEHQLFLLWGLIIFPANLPLHSVVFE